MKLIKSEKINKVITSQYIYDFDVAEEGLYAIEIIASCKSWWQNTKSFKSLLNDDDLEVRLDEREFKLDNDATSWSGNTLKGLLKTVVLIVNLSKGKHTVSLVPDKEPLVKTITIYQSDNASSLTYAPDYNNPPQDGDRRPWMSMVLVDLKFKALSIKASSKKYRSSRDDDDIKLLIDGKVERNDSKNSHKDWYWCGKVLQGASKEFNKDLDLPLGLHTIELYVDKVPKVEEISLNVEALKPKLIGKVALHQDIEQADFVNLRSEPNTGENLVLAKLKDGEEIEILEEIVIGAWVEFKSFVWHKVRYQDKIGYIVSSFVELSGQDRQTIIRKIRQQSEELELDTDTILALAGVESKYKPYACSASYDAQYEDGTLRAARGVFQLTEIAIEQLKKNKGRYYFDVADVFDIEENIAGGLRYWLWLTDTYYKGVDQQLEKTIVAWNQGHLYAPPDKPLDYNRIPEGQGREEARRTVEWVLQNRNKKDWFHIISGVVLGLVLIVLWIQRVSPMPVKNFVSEPVIAQVAGAEEVVSPVVFPKLDKVSHGEFITESKYLYDFDKDGVAEELSITEDSTETAMEPKNNIRQWVNNQWLPVTNNILGSIISVRLWKPLDIVVVEAMMGKYVDAYFFEWRGNGLYPISIVDEGQRSYSLGGLSGHKFVGEDIWFGVDVATYSFSSLSVCYGTGEMYELFRDGDISTIVKTWDLKLTQESCEYSKGS